MTDPRILSVDTSGAKLCAIISEGASVVSSHIFEGPRDHCQHIINVLTRALTQEHFELSDIDAFGCVLGPGSFTGLRIGLMAMKICAHAQQKPLLGITTFERMVLDGAQPCQYLWPAQKNHAYLCTDPLNRSAPITFGKTQDIIDANKPIIAPEDMPALERAHVQYLSFEEICGSSMAARLKHHWVQEWFLDVMTSQPLYVQNVAAVKAETKKI